MGEGARSGRAGEAVTDPATEAGTPSAPLQQLSGTDTAFLALENDATPMQVVGVLLLNPTPDYSYERLRRTIAERVHLLPPFTRRLVRRPLGLDRPYWLPVADVDLDQHISRVTAPAPGDMHVLGELVGDAAARLLPRDRPLWELTVVDGLADGRVAVIARIHHANIYGASGVDFIADLLDFDAAGREVEPPADTAVPSTPSTRSLLGRAAIHQAALPITALKLAGRAVRGVGSTGTALARRLVSGQGMGMTRPRRTPLNGTLTPARVAAFTRVPLDDLKAVKNALGGTVNDVVLAATTLALRNYFLDHGGLPVNAPTASCPMVAAGGEVSGTDRLATLLVTLPIHEADPVAALRTVSEATTGAKDFTDAIGMETVAEIADTMPPPVLSAGAGLYGALNLSRLHPPMCSLIVSNMVGPPIPLFLAGAQIEAIFPLGPLLPEVGLNVTVLSDMGTLDVGLLACPDVVPDVWSIADGFAAGVEQLRGIAGG